MEKQVNNRYSLLSFLLLIAVFVTEWVLFKTFVLREMAWSPFLNGDANWYLGHSYVVYDSLMNTWRIPSGFLTDPSGFMVFLASSVLYLFFGASRLTALSTNFIFYILWQGSMFCAVRYMTKSKAIALTMLGLCLAVAIPFQGDKTHPMLNIMEYQRDFIAFCLFGVFLTAVLFSNTFSKTKQSLIAGAIAGFTITFRYAMFFHIVGIYLSALAFLFLIFLIKKIRRGSIDLYKTRILNGIFSLLAMSAVCGYPIFLARGALYHHYFAGKLVGPKDTDFIKLYQQGVHDFVQQLLYYPRMLLGHGLGEFFFFASLVVCFFILAFIVTSLFFKWRSQKWALSDPAPSYGLFPFSLFLFIAILVPLGLLTAYPVRSGNVGLLITAPSVLVIYVFFTLFLNTFDIPGKRSLTVLKVLMAVGILSLGMSYQVKHYSTVSLCTHNKKDYLEVAELYDDIIAVSKRARLKQPRISVSFMENYVLGCGEAITAYQYEHKGELFRVTQKLGSDVGATIKKEDALNLIRESDIVLLSAREEPLESRDPLHTDPLSSGMALTPFSISIQKIRPELKAELDKNFTKEGKYRIFNREIVMYLNHQLVLAPISIKASSISNDQYGVESILDGSSVWHSTPNPVYPQWIEFEYQMPTVISQLTVRCQPGGARRAPSEFYFQGLDEQGKWLNLLSVPKASFKDQEELKSWSLKNARAFKSYRMFITKNNGEKDFVTIAQISFNYGSQIQVK